MKFAYAPVSAAKEVYLAGDFSKWQPVAMKKQKDGRFAVSLAMKPGTHEYRFIVDGQWVADPDHSLWAPNPFGTFNSVVEVR